MGKKCIVPDCKSGYLSNKERVSLFLVPKDSGLRAKWIDAISPKNSRKITTRHVVCEKHFAPSDIIRNYTHKDSNEIAIANVVYKHAKLLKTAVPSIFPGGEILQFFGTIRQAAGSNYHPATPTFLQLYKLLSTYSILKPPVSGNCTVHDQKEPKFLLTVKDLKDIYKPEKKKQVLEIQKKLNSFIEQSDWEADDILDHDYSRAPVLDCVVYFVTGVSTGISVYRGKSGILEHLVAGSITGTLYKFNMGPRGWIVGCGLGMVLGLVAGSTTLGLLKLSGMTMEDVRYWNSQWTKKRTELHRENIKQHLEKEEAEIFLEHSKKFDNTNKSLDSIE